MSVILSLLKWFVGPVGRYVLGAGLLVGVGLWYHHHVYSAGFDAGVQDTKAAYEKEFAQHLERAQKQAAQIAKEDAEVSEYHIQWRTKLVTKYQPLVDEASHAITPDCAQCRIAPEWLRRLNELRAGGGAKVPDTAAPQGAVPRASTIPDRNLRGDVPILGPGQPALLRLRGQVFRVTGLRGA